MIRATKVSKSFDGRSVLREASFEVLQGSSFVILGQSGVGKSVLLKICAGLIEPDYGNIAIGTKNIGMLFQRNALFDSLTVKENLDFPLRERTALSSAERKKKVTRFLEWVELSNTENLYPSELSGGMQKRLGIARALIVEPEVIFYDEPTAGLDPITSRMIADLILRLHKEMHTTLISVTSDVLRAYQLADNLSLLVKKEGQGATLVLAGAPDEAKESQDPMVQSFLRVNHVHSI